MATVSAVLEALETIAPARFAFPFDKVALQVGDLGAEVRKAVVALDRSLGAVQHAKSVGATLLLAHHPLIFRPIESVDSRTHVGRTILELAKNEIAFIAAHTNWDSARGGINDTLGSIFGLTDVQDFGTAAQVAMFKTVVFGPIDCLEAIVDSASAAGAGVIGEYSRCAFSSTGIGTFMASESAKPHKGGAGQRTSAEEFRVEMVVPSSKVAAVRKSIQRVHPYEEPAIDFIAMKDLAEQPAGRLGKLPNRCTLKELGTMAESLLATKALVWGDPNRSVSKVAVVGGAADEEWIHAQRAGADVLITGEVKQHVALEASESGMCLIAAGHYATEHPGCRSLRDRMAEAIPEVEWALYAPEPGFSGRPSF